MRWAQTIDSAYKLLTLSVSSLRVHATSDSWHLLLYVVRSVPHTGAHVLSHFWLQLDALGFSTHFAGQHWFFAGISGPCAMRVGEDNNCHCRAFAHAQDIFDASTKGSRY